MAVPSPAFSAPLSALPLALETPSINVTQSSLYYLSLVISCCYRNENQGINTHLRSEDLFLENESTPPAPSESMRIPSMMKELPANQKAAPCAIRASRAPFFLHLSSSPSGSHHQGSVYCACWAPNYGEQQRSKSEVRHLPAKSRMQMVPGKKKKRSDE